ncbi:MAG: MFS transporter [Pseudomonadota bacterium]
MHASPYRRDLALLTFCQAMFFMANTIIVSTAPLIGFMYAPTTVLATLPTGLQFLATMAATVPASYTMKYIGRRSGLALGATFGVGGGLLGFFAIMAGNFVMFCAATMTYGVFMAFAQYYRFAAADAADAAVDEGNRRLNGERLRGRAISIVMAGGIVAAILGPELAKATRDLFAPILFAGSYLAVAALAAVSVFTLTFITLRRAHSGFSGGSVRPLSELMRQPGIATAVFSAVVGYITMTLLMTATPIAMAACGHEFSDSAWVIQWHVFGMFAPSFFTGALIAKRGAEQVILFGIMAIGAAIAVNLSGIDVWQFTAGLFLLGIGWNFMFVGGTTLLTRCYRPSEKAKVQGCNDFIVFTTLAVAATSAGALHDILGWQVMNLLAVPGLLLVLGLLWSSHSGRSPRALSEVSP